MKAAIIIMRRTMGIVTVVCPIVVRATVVAVSTAIPLVVGGAVVAVFVTAMPGIPAAEWRRWKDTTV